MTPDEVLEVLLSHGVPIHRKTLLRWEQAGLVPEAKRKALGQGKGWETNYPAELIPEALTAYVLKDIHNLKNSEIAKAKKSFTEGKQTVYGAMYGIYLKMFNNQYPLEEVLETALVNRDNLF